MQLLEAKNKHENENIYRAMGSMKCYAMQCGIL